MPAESTRRLHEAALNAKAAQSEVDTMLGANETKGTKSIRVEDVEGVGSPTIRAALERIAPELARSYEQVLDVISDRSRRSWAGTAHEIREILSELLRYLAPDDAVKSQAWFEQDPDTYGPTQKQRVRYVLQQQNAGSRKRDVVKEMSILEDRVAGLVRATYNRASDAAHRFKGRREVIKILRYFEVFARDLLDLE